MAKVAVIGGSGLESLFMSPRRTTASTPFGDVECSVISIGGAEALFIPRHGFTHSVPPHRVNYRAIAAAASGWGATHVIATNAVGSMRYDLKPGELVIPDQFLDFTKSRPTTMFEDEVVHTDVTEAYSEDVRAALREAAEGRGLKVHYGGVYVCTEGPRYETPAEIRAFRILGGDVVGMTGVPEVALAKEIGLHYASLSVVTNMAAGMQSRISHEEVIRLMDELNPKVKGVVEDAASMLMERGGGGGPRGSA